MDSLAIKTDDYGAVVVSLNRFDSLKNFQAWVTKRQVEYGATVFVAAAYMMPVGTRAGFQLAVRAAAKIKEPV